jgi:hypothetical protein
MDLRSYAEAVSQIGHDFTSRVEKAMAVAREELEEARELMMRQLGSVTAALNGEPNDWEVRQPEVSYPETRGPSPRHGVNSELDDYKTIPRR